MKAIEDDILEQLYFVASFQSVATETGHDPAEAEKAITEMLRKGWVEMLQYNAQSGDYESVSLSGHQDRIADGYFVATKKGLLAHQGLADE